MEEKILKAIVCGVLGWGSRRLTKWLAEHASLSVIQNFTVKDLVHFGLNPAQANLTYTFFQKNSIESYSRIIEKHQIKIVTITEPEYPQLLGQISDAPYVLFYRGILQVEMHAIAVVGTRKPTQYGQNVTAQCVQYLVNTGATIVSGLAYGVDAIAHKTALDSGGYTIAVLGSSIDQITPVGNSALGQHILSQGGALISEYGPGHITKKQNFISRNRIVSGLSQGVLITEGASGSGSLATAEFGIKQGRKVYAVPGNITSPMSQAPNSLIKQGAEIVTNPADIQLEGFHHQIPLLNSPIHFESEIEEKVFQAIITQEQSVQEICIATGLSIMELNQVLTEFELQGLIVQERGIVRRV